MGVSRHHSTIKCCCAIRGRADLYILFQKRTTAQMRKVGATEASLSGLLEQPAIQKYQRQRQDARPIVALVHFCVPIAALEGLLPPVSSRTPTSTGHLRTVPQLRDA